MWLFLSLYLQDVLGMSPLIAGLAFVPQTLAIIAGAQISSRLVARIGPRLPLVTGAVLAVIGMAALSRIAATDSYFTVVFWAATLATFGMGLTMTPLAFSATTGVAPAEAGLASGVLNSSRQIGGSLALAVLATLAADRTQALAHHASAAVAATAGFARAFEVGAAVALAGALCAQFVVPARRPTHATGGATVGTDGAEPGTGERERPPASPRTVGELALEPEG